MIISVETLLTIDLRVFG